MVKFILSRVVTYLYTLIYLFRIIHVFKLQMHIFPRLVSFFRCNYLFHGYLFFNFDIKEIISENNRFKKVKIYLFYYNRNIKGTENIHVIESDHTFLCELIKRCKCRRSRRIMPSFYFEKIKEKNT